MYNLLLCTWTSSGNATIPGHTALRTWQLWWVQCGACERGGRVGSGQKTVCVCERERERTRVCVSNKFDRTIMTAVPYTPVATRT